MRVEGNGIYLNTFERMPCSQKIKFWTGPSR